MLQIAVCEDEKEDLEVIRRSISEIMSKLCFEAEIDCFTTGEALLTAVQGGRKYSFLLLDVYLAGAMDGVETAKCVSTLMPEAVVAFVTSSPDFSVEAFNLNAVHYIIKPVTTQKLQAAFERFFERSHVPLRLVEIKTGSKVYSFPMHKIRKIQSFNKGVEVYLQGIEQPQPIPLAFMRVEAQLPEGCFLRISRGVLVSMEYILCINADACRLRDGTEMLISRRDKAAIRSRYNDYLFRK